MSDLYTIAQNPIYQNTRVIPDFSFTNNINGEEARIFAHDPNVRIASDFVHRVVFDFISNGYFQNNVDSHIAIVARCNTDAISSGKVQGCGIVMGNVSDYPGGRGNPVFPSAQIETFFAGLHGTDSLKNNDLLPESSWSGTFVENKNYRIAVDVLYGLDRFSRTRYQIYDLDDDNKILKDTGYIVDGNIWYDPFKNGVVIGYVFGNTSASTWTMNFSNIRSIVANLNEIVVDENAQECAAKPRPIKVETSTPILSRSFNTNEVVLRRRVSRNRAMYSGHWNNFSDTNKSYDKKPYTADGFSIASDNELDIFTPGVVQNRAQWGIFSFDGIKLSIEDTSVHEPPKPDPVSSKKTYELFATVRTRNNPASDSKQDLFLIRFNQDPRNKRIMDRGRDYLSNLVSAPEWAPESNSFPIFGDNDIYPGNDKKFYYTESVKIIPEAFERTATPNDFSEIILTDFETPVIDLDFLTFSTDYPGPYDEVDFQQFFLYVEIELTQLNSKTVYTYGDGTTETVRSVLFEEETLKIEIPLFPREHVKKTGATPCPEVFEDIEITESCSLPRPIYVKSANSLLSKAFVDEEVNYSYFGAIESVTWDHSGVEGGVLRDINGTFRDFFNINLPNVKCTSVSQGGQLGGPVFGQIVVCGPVDHSTRTPFGWSPLERGWGRLEGLKLSLNKRTAKPPSRANPITTESYIQVKADLRPFTRFAKSVPPVKFFVKDDHLNDPNITNEEDSSCNIRIIYDKKDLVFLDESKTKVKHTVIRDKFENGVIDLDFLHLGGNFAIDDNGTPNDVRDDFARSGNYDNYSLKLVLTIYELKEVTKYSYRDGFVETFEEVTSFEQEPNKTVISIPIGKGDTAPADFRCTGGGGGPGEPPTPEPPPRDPEKHDPRPQPEFEEENLVPPSTPEEKIEFAVGVVKNVVTAPVNPQMFGALVSAAAVLGPSAFKKHKFTILFNAGNVLAAAEALAERNSYKDLGIADDKIDAVLQALSPMKYKMLEGGYLDEFGEFHHTPQSLDLLAQQPGYVPREQFLPNDPVGFQDPGKQYPKQSNKGEPDVNRLGRQERTRATSVYTKEMARHKDVLTAKRTSKWSQPVSGYNSRYPYNKVMQTESGHILEFDDTPGSERINIHHKSGSFIEIDDKGTKVSRTTGDNYEIQERDGKVHIAGNSDVTIGGASTVRVENTYDLQVHGAANINIFNNAKIQVRGDVTAYVGGNVLADVVGDFDIRCKSTFRVTAEKISLMAQQEFYASSEGPLNLGAGGEIGIDGKATYLQSGKTVWTDVDPYILEKPKFEPKKVVLPQQAPHNRIEEQTAVFESPDEGSDEEKEGWKSKRIAEGTASSAELESTGVKDPEKDRPAQRGTAPTDVEVEVPQGREFRADDMISKYFTLGDMTMKYSRKLNNLYGSTAEEKFQNLCYLATNVLDPIKKKWPGMIITSGLRDFVPAGGSQKSQHLVGQAVDIAFPGMSRKDLPGRASEISAIIPYDQMLLEYSTSGNGWIHISLRKQPRAQSFTMYNHKKVSGDGEFVYIA
jgi:hypothetical protein